MGLMMVFFGTMALFHLLTGNYMLADQLELVRQRGGAIGSLLAFPMSRVIGYWGTFVVLAARLPWGC